MEKLISTVLVTLLTLFLIGFIFMLVWNWIAPLYWANAPELTYWQAWGTMLLIRYVLPYNSINHKE